MILKDNNNVVEVAKAKGRQGGKKKAPPPPPAAKVRECVFIFLFSCLESIGKSKTRINQIVSFFVIKTISDWGGFCKAGG